MTIRPLILFLLAVAPPVVAPSAARAAPPAKSSAPQTRGLYLQLIGQARSDGRPRAALAYLDDFDKRFPGDVGAQVLRVNSLLDLGQVDEAERIVAALAKVQGNATVDAVRGHALAARGHWREASERYQAAVAASPADPLLRNALGYAQLRAGEGDSAIEELRGACDLAPGETVIRNNLLLAYAVTGRKQELSAGIRTTGNRKAQAELLRTITTEAKRIAREPALPGKENGR
ncbi:pilus assembly protein TadD [Rhizorhabdus wittichii DC-6]|uniref:Tetratricopeptide TPR_4 n=1 Tax=Rhizorhabdus wittichii (strain DSM 6014 / CCUG 31198 / JCM 15750 / NBRC 105917 / EY 4224 / RW1) TaxID=392499 RepID=A0A9J9HDS1_RHIWR|nr:Tetratricopeptide TPR_4 [Rhizorhabdus wittichii RW1]ARR53164.1 pilus assembly protein TadD [Rhizorhabdus wittichii DC-6]